MTIDRWEHFPHAADMGIRGIGRSKQAAFEEAAMALSAVITDPANVATRESVDILCEAPDDELLLVDWLNALVYFMATQRMLFSRFKVQLDDHQLRGQAWGEKVDVSKHQPAVEIKGATLTCLRVGQEPDGSWVAQCVVDV
jgi:tRNA nucleotidyltransferase (CCA-adding enzyme)